MRESLTRGLAQLGLSPDAVPQLEAYAAALLEKNRVMNLTAITAPQDVATLHLLDCATLLTMADLRGKRVIDVGTGAGFPGMVLRILEPDFDLTLLDSRLRLYMMKQLTNISSTEERSSQPTPVLLICV